MFGGATNAWPKGAAPWRWHPNLVGRAVSPRQPYSVAKPEATRPRTNVYPSGDARELWLRPACAGGPGQVWLPNQHAPARRRRRHARCESPQAPELAESGAGYEVIMSIAGHVSRAMLSRYSHVRMEAKRRALDEIAARQCAADKKHKVEAERREQGAAVSSAAVIQ